MKEKRFYEVKFTESAEKDLKKLSKTNKAIAKLLKKWISENLINTQNPKQRGKALTGNLKGLWRYRVGSYRIVVEIKDEVLLILIVEISDRRETYKNKKVTKTAKFISYEENIENLVPTISGYNTEQEYKSKMIIKQAIAIYNGQLEIFRNGGEFDFYLYVMHVLNISDNGFQMHFDFPRIHIIGNSKDDIERRLKTALELRYNLNNLFDKNHQW